MFNSFQADLQPQGQPPAPSAPPPATSTAPQPPLTRHSNPAWSETMLNTPVPAPVPPPTMQPNPARSQTMLSTTLPAPEPLEPQGSSFTAAADAAGTRNLMQLGRGSDARYAPENTGSRRPRHASDSPSSSTGAGQSSSSKPTTKYRKHR